VVNFRSLLAALLAAAPAVGLSVPVPTRPPILGVAHIAFYAHDLNRSRAFYEDFLGFAEPFSAHNPDGTLRLTWIKINDRQFVELFPETAPGTDRLHEISFQTADAEAMRRYLQSRGVEVPESVTVGQSKAANFAVHDPDGHKIEFVQYLPHSWVTTDAGRHLPETRIAVRMSHVGVIVSHLEASQRFYGDILGFKEIWRGSRNQRDLSWVKMRVPEGTDWLEFMLYDPKHPPTSDRLRVYHHFCLQIPDVAKAMATLNTRSLPAGCKPPTKITAAADRLRQTNYYDPDGSRVEMMEAKTFDGSVAPSSPLQPPSS
jgi:catechol 2,3-dioxygenase-like lactoylglutathione lyase family enzyme